MYAQLNCNLCPYITLHHKLVTFKNTQVSFGKLLLHKKEAAMYNYNRKRTKVMNNFNRVMLVDAMSERTLLLSTQYTRTQEGKRAWTTNWQIKT
jgi:hypothetical protein